MTRRLPTDAERLEHVRQIAERHAFLPIDVMPPTRANTAVCVPCQDGRVEFGFMTGLIDSLPLWGGLIQMPFCSHVSLARNRLIHAFRQSPFEWCVMIDTDILFKQADFAALMEGTDFAVSAPYAKKDDSGEMIDKGLGFARIHRSVFDVLEKTLCMSSTFRGERLTDFFVNGSLGNDVWMGEDTAFWFLCENIGVKPRMETRTRLRHVGRREYEISEFLSVGPADLSSEPYPHNMIGY